MTISGAESEFFWISNWVVAAAIIGFLLIAALGFLLRQDIDFTLLNYFSVSLLARRRQNVPSSGMLSNVPQALQ